MESLSLSSLPWWGILIIILGLIVIVGLGIPLVRFFLNKRDGESKAKASKPVERATLQPQKDPKNAPYLGFNWFGKKQAVRTERLVYVQELEDSCPLCAPFENQVISLADYGQNVTVMDEAISRGYHHLGCKHVDLDYFHGTTSIPQNKWTTAHKKQRYALRLEQYRFEDKIRNLKYQIDNNAKSKANQTKLVNQLKFQEEELEKFCLTNKLERNLERENYKVSELHKFS